MIRIQKSYLIAFIALITFFQPTFISVLPFVGKFYNGLRVLTFLSVSLYAIKTKQSLPFASIMLIIGEFWLLILTVTKHGQIQAELINFMMLFSLVMLVNIYKEDFHVFLSSLLLHFELTIYINLLSLMLFPERLFSRVNSAYGLTFEWFLGSRNNFIIWLLPGLLIALLYRHYNKSNKRANLLIASVFLTQLFQTSSTLIVTSIILLVLSITPYLKRVFRPFISLALALFVQFLIVVASNVEFLAPIVQGILGKDLTFTNRTTIWKNALNHISLYSGYGRVHSDKAATVLGNFGSYIWKGATHAHNQLLNLGVQGGLLLVVITLYIYIVCFWKSEKYWKNSIAQIYSFGVFAYIIAGITEITSNLLLQLMLILPLFLDKTILEADNNYSIQGNEVHEKL
ncbi:Putative oligosaccharide repeat unit polymerase [Streptococcus thermophilus]|uniref:O-antigen ligase family protein n=1 Tax=Streptococcus thermophilus TaxID=1308 RepID=UPI0015C279B0|nr:O-antigen ligase family protein [Streptococcus thermophilus]CAD0147624.1 Putative oligosaccharide repeat unit polymerase [Streptococcus thermophilus]CAD0150108.1 Putative oligosaccharide repeat unit polymerase [Streptococcus thermophilus]